MVFKLAIVLLVATVAFKECQSAAAKIDGTKLSGEVAEGADTLTGVIGKVDSMFLKPVLNKVDEQIKKINLDLDGITKEEKDIVYEALKRLALAKNNIKSTRNVLKQLAQETIDRSNSIKKYLGITFTKQGPSARMGLKFSANKMASLLKRTETLLTEAKKVYSEASDKCATVKVDLNMFSGRVDRLTQEWSQEHQKAVKDLRTKAYAGAAASFGFGPLAIITAPATYAAVAAIVETTIKKWKDNLKAARTQAFASKALVDKIAGSVKGTLDMLRTEEGIVRTWESTASRLKDDITNGDEWIEFLEWDKSIRDDQLEKFNKLIKVCQQFLDHVKANELKDVV